MEKREAHRRSRSRRSEIARELREDEPELLEAGEAREERPVEAPERRRVRARGNVNLNDVAVLEVEDEALEVGGQVRDPEVAERGEGGVVRGDAGGRAEERDGGVVPEDLEAGELGEEEVVVLGTYFHTRREYEYGRS